MKAFLTTINDMPHQLSAAGIQARNIYRVSKKVLSKKGRSNLSSKEFLTTKFGL